MELHFLKITWGDIIILKSDDEVALVDTGYDGNFNEISDYLDNKKIIIAILLVASIFTLLICSKNSPLYPYNDWVDGNAFFTMGKGMFNGKVPYKDLFEQKGPLLYLIYGIGYLISHDTFLGVYLLEVISYLILPFN